VTPADDTDATEEDTAMTSTNQNDPLGVYYAEVLAATNKFYAAMDRQAAEEKRRAEQAQARADEHHATILGLFEQYAADSDRRRRSAAAKAGHAKARAKAEAADQTPSPEHDG
jgi:hypothetical protein